MKITSKKYDIGYGKLIRKVKPVAELVDEFLSSEVVENGVPQRRTAFEVICLQLCDKAMVGNRRALKVLKQYIDFAASRAPSGGMRAVLVDEETQRKMLRGENG
jgi:hypothetical protein